MRILDAAAVEAATPWAALADALRRHLADPIASPPRSVIDPTGAGDALLLMPAWRDGGVMAVKLVTVYPRESPALDGVVVAFDQASGKVRAVLDGMAITNRRTAAAAALASSLLARRGSRSLLVIGTGALAGPLAQAHRAICGIGHVTIWGRSASRAAALAATVGAEASTDLAGAIAQADIIAAATTATTPLIPSQAVRPGTHVCLVGAFTPAMAEAEPALLARAALIHADDRASVLAKGGEVVQAIRAGIIAESALRGGLAELCAAPPARADDAITVYKSVGFAALDLIATELALSPPGSA
jgi:ornithine cyclodeaminase